MTALLWHQLRFERRLFWRNPSAAYFSFALPLIFLVLIASVFAGDAQDQLEVLVPGIAGMAVMATTFSSLAYNLTFRREQGILKRMLGTPQPPGTYLGGMIGSGAVSALIQVALIVTIGKLAYDVGWPEDWLALAVFTLLGVTCFASLGIAFSHVIPNWDSTNAYVNAVFLPLIFISGVFYSADALPPVLEAIAEALPLKHVIDGLSGAIVSGEGLGDNLPALAVVGGWTAVGIGLGVRFFRWE